MEDAASSNTENNIGSMDKTNGYDTKEEMYNESVINIINNINSNNKILY